VKQLLSDGRSLSAAAAHPARTQTARTHSCPDYDSATLRFWRGCRMVRRAIGDRSEIPDGVALDPDRRGEVICAVSRLASAARSAASNGVRAVDAEQAYFACSDILTRTRRAARRQSTDRTAGRGTRRRCPPSCAAGPRCNAAQAAAISVIPGIVFSGANDGTLPPTPARPRNSVAVHTDREFQTVNGRSRQGSFDAGSRADDCRRHVFVALRLRWRLAVPPGKRVARLRPVSLYARLHVSRFVTA